MSVAANKLEQLVGKWKLESSDNFENYMKELGVGWALRKVALAQKPTITISHEELDSSRQICDDGVEWTLQTATAVKTSQVKFQLKKMFKHTTIYDKLVNAIFEVDEEGKLKETHQFDGKVMSVTYRFVNDHDEMMTVAISNDVTTTRKYKRSNDGV